jgi:seryl-tRNA synthetase
MLVVLDVRGLPGAPHGAAIPREAGRSRSIPHTLNASGLALPRTFATLLENHQTAAGGIRIPAALRPYLDGREEWSPAG